MISLPQIKTNKPFNFRLIAAGASFKAILVGLLSLWLISTLARYAADLAVTLDAPAWVPPVLRAVAYLSSAFLALLCLWLLWSMVVRAAKALLPLFIQTDTVEIASDTPDLGPEVPEIKQAVVGLSRALSDLETDSSAASLRLLDAGQYAANLVALIKAINLKADAMRAEVTELQAALDAVATSDPLAIARAAGYVRDAHIRELLLCTAPTLTYWAGVTRLIATQLGTLDQWSGSYDQFIVNLLGEISSAKVRLVSTSASLELVGTARPLLQIQANLDEAQAYLQIPHRPELAPAVKTLPALSVGLLK